MLPVELAALIGLSPRIAEFVFSVVADIRDKLGKSVLMAAQNVEQVPGLADHANMLRR